MARHPRLAKRGNVYILRAKVPADLIPIIGKREIKKTLGTSDPRLALEKVRLESPLVDAIFAEARRKLSVVLVATVSDDDLRRIVLAWFARSERAALDRVSETIDDDGVVDQFNEDEAALSDGASPVAMTGVQLVAKNLLKEAGVDLAPSSASFRFACELIRRGMSEGVRRARKRFLGQPDSADDHLFADVGATLEIPATPSLGKSEPDSLPLAQLITDYETDPNRGGLSPKTADSYAVIFRALRELLGKDKPVREITRDDCKRVRDTLMRLPPNATKRFPGLTLQQAADMAAEKGLQPISTKTLNGYVNNLSALFTWAQHEEKMTSNPARKLAVAKADDDEGARQPFAPAQLQAIFSAPLYTGCVDDQYGYAKPGPNVIRGGRFWLPLITLHSGLRLNEAAQLLVGDVQFIDETHVISVCKGPGKRLKTKASERIMPIHPELIRMGFLDYVEKMRRAKETRLFPDLPAGRNGYFSDPYQKWFSRFLVQAKARQIGTTFHSFRHNFRDAMREADIPLERAKALGGWEGSSGTEAAYGRGFRASTLAAEIAKVKYPSLDLSHLYIHIQ